MKSLRAFADEPTFPWAPPMEWLAQQWTEALPLPAPPLPAADLEPTLVRSIVRPLVRPPVPRPRIEPVWVQLQRRSMCAIVCASSCFGLLSAYIVWGC